MPSWPTAVPPNYRARFRVTRDTCIAGPDCRNQRAAERANKRRPDIGTRIFRRRYISRVLGTRERRLFRGTFRSRTGTRRTSKVHGGAADDDVSNVIDYGLRVHRFVVAGTSGENVSRSTTTKAHPEWTFPLLLPENKDRSLNPTGLRTT